MKLNVDKTYTVTLSNEERIDLCTELMHDVPVHDCTKALSKLYALLSDALLY